MYVVTVLTIFSVINIICIHVFQFDLHRINNSSSKLNPELLDEFNRLEIIEHLNDPVKSEELIQNVQHLIQKTYPKEYVK